MKLKMEQDPFCADIEVTVRYTEKNNKVKRIISFLQSVDMQIKCDIDNTEKMINVADIYYIESVEKKDFCISRKVSLSYGFPFISINRRFERIRFRAN